MSNIQELANLFKETDIFNENKLLLQLENEKTRLLEDINGKLSKRIVGLQDFIMDAANSRIEAATKPAATNIKGSVKRKAEATTEPKKRLCRYVTVVEKKPFSGRSSNQLTVYTIQDTRSGRSFNLWQVYPNEGWYTLKLDTFQLLTPHYQKLLNEMTVKGEDKKELVKEAKLNYDIDVRTATFCLVNSNWIYSFAQLKDYQDLAETIGVFVGLVEN